jgi:hypothetical protein
MYHNEIFVSSASRALRAARNLALTNISVWIVSAFKLDRRNPIVSRPPEKTRSTATAEPGRQSVGFNKIFGTLTRDTKHIAHESIKVGHFLTTAIPPLKWVSVVVVWFR